MAALGLAVGIALFGCARETTPIDPAEPAQSAAAEISEPEITPEEVAFAPTWEDLCIFELSEVTASFAWGGFEPTMTEEKISNELTACAYTEETYNSDDDVNGFYVGYGLYGADERMGYYKGLDNTKGDMTFATPDPASAFANACAMAAAYSLELKPELQNLTICEQTADGGILVMPFDTVSYVFKADYVLELGRFGVVWAPEQRQSLLDTAKLAATRNIG